MTAELISAFLVVILKWLELDERAKPELQERMECFAECLTRIVRHMSISSLTEHLVTVWIMVRRVQCVLRGIDLESTTNISYRSIGGNSPTTQGFQLTCRAGRSAAQHRDRSKSSPAGRVDSGLQTGRAT